METWRIIAAILLAVVGMFGVLIIMAKVRDRSDSSPTVAVAGLVSFTTLAVLCVLALTVLPGAVTWGMAAVVAVIVSVLALAS
ncbi:hypothetical protein [Prauserella cavernicola]|uniref:Uncharacterized protein n=1 Tax=Prauserella cavernicola TaxID=2800127 RepID=A0A934QN50_9PSEU|nr:hypothetical protein [Prauserella cavernicola]MBK1785062.1 hypothetical protein [Prauserella cavernicola]